jgi:predicted metal-dependent phosphoesterase TrpH
MSKKYNLDTIAFTDHDSIISSKQVETIQDVKGIRWISGVEISSGLPLDIGGGSSSSLHIVGLFVDYNNQELKNYCKLAQEARVERMVRMTKNLNSIGFEITQDDCIRQSGGEAVARPHIVKALLSYEKNLKRMEDIKEDMRKASEKDSSLTGDYNRLAELPIEQYPYILFFTEDSFIKDIYVDYLYYLDFDKSVKLIRDSGGIAILAHYFTISNKITPDILEPFVKEKRIDGLETVFGLYAFGTSEEQRIVDSMNITRKIAEKYNCITSGGADIHTEKDLKMLVENTEYANQTTNLLEKMLSKFEVNTTHSNF